ncbi:MAG: acetylxylan esterase [Verrucomicrobia bacterium]|nr:acetylxylan esterase [Verrucomicrobiota bacterium]
MSSPSSSPLTRRGLLRHAGLGAVAVSTFGTAAFGAEPKKKNPAPAKAPPAPADLVPLNRFGRMMQEYYVALLRAVEAQGNARRAALRTKADAEAYLRDIRQKILQCFGAFPERTPLNPRVTGTLVRDGYKVEKVIFDSRPNFPVTANLYLPTNRSGKLPAVVGTCGHSATGKAGDTYQSFAQGLARLGYICLIYDPIGQGERLQHVADNWKPRHGVGTSEHLYVGARMGLTGEFLGSWFNWDGIRALDYLLTRPEVDSRHLGLTGNSGGGTQSTWLCGVEPRFTMAAPSCFVTTFRRNLENELPADTEQCPPRALALGLDHADFIAAMAPKPVIVMGQEKDFFDARGLEEAHARLQHLYGLLGQREAIGLHLGPDYHGYSQANREAMYRWFNHATRISNATKEPTLKLEKDEDLWCTPHGQIAELRPATILTLTTALSRQQATRRGQPEGPALGAAVQAALRLPPRAGVPDYRILRPSSGRRYPKRFAATYAVETEPGITALVYRLADETLLSRPPRDGRRALLYLAHHSADAELRDEPLIGELLKAEPKVPFFAADLRGLGESLPTTGSYTSAYGSDYFYAAHGHMLDYPYVAQRTHDVLRLVDWLKSCGHDEVHLVAKGFAAIPAALGAVLAESVTQVTLKHALTSYTAVAEAEDYQWPFSALLPGVLQHFDLPDCYRFLARKNLRQIEPWNALAKTG